MDKEKKEILDELVFVELNVITAVTVARHLNISTDEANEFLKQYYDHYSKSVHAVYTVSGQMVKAGVSCGAILLARDVELKETEKQFEKVDRVDLFAIHKDPVKDLASVFTYDAVQDERFFRDDAERAPIKAIQVRKFREEIQAPNQETSPRQGSARGSGTTPAKASVKAEVKQESAEKQKAKLNSMFQKACDREKVHKNSPKKVRESPFTTPHKVSDPDDSPSPKRRARRILIDSEDELSPNKKLKAADREELLEEKSVGAPKKKTRADQPSTTASAMEMENDDIFEAASPEKSSPVNKFPTEKKKTSKKVIEDSGNKTLPVVRRSPRKIIPSTTETGKRKVYKKDYETYIDADGFLCTKEVLKEVEVDDDENAAPERAATSHKPEPPKTTAKGKKAAPAGQAKISSFFTKK